MKPREVAECVALAIAFVAYIVAVVIPGVLLVCALRIGGFSHAADCLEDFIGHDLNPF